MLMEELPITLVALQISSVYFISNNITTDVIDMSFLLVLGCIFIFNVGMGHCHDD